MPVNLGRCHKASITASGSSLHQNHSQGLEYVGCRALDLSLASTKSVCIVGAAKNLPLSLAVGLSHRAVCGLPAGHPYGWDSQAKHKGPPVLVRDARRVSGPAVCLEGPGRTAGLGLSRTVHTHVSPGPRARPCARHGQGTCPCRALPCRVRVCGGYGPFARCSWGEGALLLFVALLRDGCRPIVACAACGPFAACRSRG